MCFDDNRHTAAQQLWATGLHAAQVCGDRSIGASILNFMSYQASGLGNYREGDALADVALGGRACLPARIEALLLARKALAQSRLSGDRQSAHNLNLAFQSMERSTNAEQPSWSHWFKEAELCGIAGRVFFESENFSEASKHLRTAISVQSDQFVRGKALYIGQLAVAQIHLGNLDEAVHLGEQCLTATKKVESKRLVSLIGDIGHRLEPFQANRSARNLRDQMVELVRLH